MRYIRLANLTDFIEMVIPFLSLSGIKQNFPHQLGVRFLTGWSRKRARCSNMKLLLIVMEIHYAIIIS